jgi:hypothetical protein
MRRLILWALSLLLLATTSFAQSIPPIKGKTLADTEIVLPKPGSQQMLILVVGFSHKSSEACAPWGKRLFNELGSDSRVAVYQLPVLEGAPAFIRPMILRGMRKDIPADRQSHFVPILDHEADWKKLVNFSGPDDAYVLLTDSQGQVIWQTHGPVSDASCDALKSAVSKALATQRPA